MPKGLHPNSLANLAKGRARKGNRPKRPGGPTWADLITEYGERSVPPEFANFGKTWKEVVVAAAYRQAALGNASILRELMQRSEPQLQEHKVMVQDWRQIIESEGLEEAEVIAEAERIIQSHSVAGGEERSQAEEQPISD